MKGEKKIRIIFCLTFYSFEMIAEVIYNYLEGPQIKSSGDYADLQMTKNCVLEGGKDSDFG